MPHGEAELSAPMHVCISTDPATDYTTRFAQYNAHECTLDEALDALRTSHEGGLVHMAYTMKGEDSISLICSCCPYCCHTLGGLLRHGIATQVLTSRFIAEQDYDRCRACRKCADRCVFGARDFKEGKLFDAVVWISAKKKRLVLTGIDEIVPSLTTYENLVNAILEVLGFTTSTGMRLEEKEKEVKGLLSTAKCLIVVDNLEAVEDERIFDFLKNLPEPSKALITSRKRLGEVERIVRLKEMSFDETKRLILLDALDKSVEQLIKADDKVFSEIYKVTGGIPLAIRWVVGWTSMGSDISSVCAKVRKAGSPLPDFCFQEIYDTLLTTQARTVFRYNADF